MGKRKNEDSRNFLKILLLILIIGVLAVLAYTGKIFINGKEQSTSSNDVNTIQTTNTTKRPNETKPVDVGNNTVVEEKTDDENKKEEESEETTVSDEEKAIELAKKQYGSTDGVYYHIDENVGSGVYIISVRKSGETSALAWYKVDVKKQTVTDF